MHQGFHRRHEITFLDLSIWKQALCSLQDVVIIRENTGG